MKDDSLSRVGKHVKDEQRDDARFERVARGNADDADLRALAAEDPEIATRLEASRPLEASAVERIAARVATVRAEERGAPRRVVQLGRWTLRRTAAIVGPLAIAAGLLLYVMSPSDPGALPAYATYASGAQTMRGPTTEGPARIRVEGADTRFEIVLRPAVAATSKVVAYAFTADGAHPANLRPLDAPVEIAAEGAVRISGPARVLDGATEIRVVVAAGDLSRDAAARAAAGADDPHVHVATIPVDR